MKYIKNTQKVFGVIWLLIYILISIKFLKSAGVGSWGTNENLLYLDTSSIPMLGRFFPSLSSYLPKMELLKELFCIISSALLILNTKNSRKIFLFLMLFNIVDALISCYILKIEMNFYPENAIYSRTFWAEYVIIFLSMMTFIILYKFKRTTTNSDFMK